MKVVIQRVKSSSVSVAGKLIHKIDNGLNVLVGINVEDTHEDLIYLVNKIVNLRIFDDENDVMNKSILDVGGSILSISQFTLQADTKKGNRPSYIHAMRGEDAFKLYEEFNIELNKFVPTYPGVFGADMLISIENDGPITIVIDSKDK
ncbi:MAG: D-tyrosyl-tRNA(Tyr) deacylase [Erysipelotrichales bacterium]|nr:D-tyrosyl-tRNA(Tyr) deacylase [Erysipelotrichales bacterium]